MGLRSGAKTFYPTDLSGCKLWLSAHSGITTVDAAIPTQALSGWETAFNLTSRTATVLTEDSSVDTIHGVSYPAVSINMHPYHAYHVKIGLPYATGNGRYVLIATGNGAEQLYLDLQTGTIPYTTANISNAVYSSGVLDFDATSPAGPNIYLLTWDGGSYSLTHNGNGARTLTVSDNGNGEYVTLTQKNVSVWNDNTIYANNATQSTAEARPLRDTNTKLGLIFDGVNDSIIVADSNSLDTGFGGYTLVAQYTTPSSWWGGEVYKGLIDKSNGSAWPSSSDALGWGLAVGNTGKLAACHAGYNSNYVCASTLSTNTDYTLAVSGYGSGNVTLYLNGVQDATFTANTPATNNNAYSIQIGRAGTGTRWLYGKIRSVVIYNRDLTAAEHLQLSRWLAKRP